MKYLNPVRYQAQHEFLDKYFQELDSFQIQLKVYVNNRNKNQSTYSNKNISIITKAIISLLNGNGKSILSDNNKNNNKINFTIDNYNCNFKFNIIYKDISNNKLYKR